MENAPEAMRRVTGEELRLVLEQHRLWVESGGKVGSRANLSRCDLSGENLEGAMLSGAKLLGCNLSKARLIAADLSGSYLANADLSQAELSLANLTNARLTDARLVKAELHHANLSGAYLDRADLSNADLRHATLFQADMHKILLVGADMHRVNLCDANLSQANVSQSDLSKAVGHGADFTAVDLTHTNLAYAEFTRARFTRARLFRANLTAADLSGSRLVGADLRRAKLKGTRLADADLRSALLHRFDETFVRGAQFTPLTGRWWAFLCEIGFGPMSRWLGRRGFSKASRQFAFTIDHNDPWSVLRQSYAGPRVLFLFFMVIVFVLPYAGRAAVFSAVGPVEREAEAVLKYRKKQVEIRLASDPGDPAASDELAGINRILLRMDRKPVWQVLLRWETGKSWPTILAALLIVYNIGLYSLIVHVSALRDEEERSGWTPAWRDYGYLLWFHRVVVVLFYVSCASFLINVGQILDEEVLIPRLG